MLKDSTNTLEKFRNLKTLNFKTFKLFKFKTLNLKNVAKENRYKYLVGFVHKEGD